MKPDLGQFPRHVRRAVMLGATKSALSLSPYLSPSAATSVGAVIGQVARWVPPLRRRLKKTLTLALGAEKVPPHSVDQYFYNLGRSYGWGLAIYHRGFWRSPVPEHFEFDPSIAHLDRAVARGKGVILLAPHQFCEELAGAYIGGRHKIVVLMRESEDHRRAAMKVQWYHSTGMDTIRRPRRSSLVSDMVACMKVLTSGRILALAPDVIVSQGMGIPVELFGREIHLSPGFLLLSMKQQASVVTGYIHWKSRDRISLSFTEPIEYPRFPHQRSGMIEGLQSWCRQFEQYLCENPQNWRFWLDKRWSGTFRSPNRKVGSQ
jgi:lauroyl/myristoyl acyltransferase